MEVIHLNKAAFDEAILRSAEIFRKGGVAILPTDTVYGLAADATNVGAVKKVFAIKRRARLKAIPIFVSDLISASRAAVIPIKAIEILKALWPGQTTAVFKKREMIPDAVTGGGKTVGLRIPDYLFLNSLLDRYPNPITATSANLSGLEPADSPQVVREMFRSATYLPDLLVDAGALPSSPASTVLDLTCPDRPKILRMGAVTKEKLDELFRHLPK